MDLFMMYLENNFGHELPAETMEYIENLNNIEHLKYVTEYFDSIEILDFKGDPMIFQHPLKIDDLLEKGVHAFNAVSVSPNFHKMDSYRVVKGRDFTDEDMPYIQGKPRPVLVGYKYMDYYDVGDILSIPGSMTYSDLVTELEIIGFLEEDTSILASNGTVVHDLDNYIVMPVIYMNWDEYVRMDDKYKHVLSTEIWNTNYMTTLGATKFYVPFEYENEVLAELQQALNNYSAASQCYRLTDAGQISLKWQSRTEALTSFFAETTAVLMFFSVITVLISIVNRVSRNVKDYAIHIAVGATKKSAVAFIFAEMTILLMCSIIIGTIATKLVINYEYMPFYFWQSLTIYTVTSVIILVLSAVITLISMRKYDVCTLIK